MGLTSVLSVLLATGALAIDIPSTPTWPSGRCTDKSLTIPSWTIQDYVVKGGVATFQVVNRASESSDCCAFITCSPGKETCQGSAGADEMTVKWKKGADGNTVISVSDFWYCSDVGDKTVFTASGSTTITSCNGDDCTSPIDYLAQGSLTLPVPLTPAQPSPPTGYDAPTCAKVGEDEWEVSGVQYQNVTKGQCTQWYIPDRICLNPNNDFLARGEYLSLNVTNNAITYNVQCSFTPTYDNHSLPATLRCTGGNFNEITLDVSWSGTAPNFNLKIEQLWYCLENPLTNANPSVIVATGNVSLPLKCSSTTGITGSADDIITTCTDPASSRSVDGSQTAKQSLPAWSLITAYPVHGGCTYDSIVNPTFYYRGLSFATKPYPESDPDSATLNRINAGLTGPGFANHFFDANTPISGQGVNTVYSCSGSGSVEQRQYNCTYAFNPFTKVITQDKVWACSDKDAKKPLYFAGTGEFDWSIDPQSTCSNSGTASNTSLSCLWHDDMTALPPGIPYDIPKVRASLVNVSPSSAKKAQGSNGFASDTVRVNRKWQLVSGGS